MRVRGEWVGFIIILFFCRGCLCQQEIESVKRRREEREKEEALIQQQREELQREKEREHYEEYAKKEEVFHRVNQLKKTEIRLEQNRAQVIDHVVKGLRIIKGERFEKMDVLRMPPHEVFENYKSDHFKTERKPVRHHADLCVRVCTLPVSFLSVQRTPMFMYTLQSALCLHA